MSGPHGWNVQVDVGVWQIVYGPTIFFAKLTLLLLYFRLFSFSRWTGAAIYFGITATGVFYAATTVAYGTQCVRRPGQKWLVASERCTSTFDITYAQGTFGVVSDIYIFILPMSVLWGLQMSLSKKLGVAAIFLTGLM